MIYSEKKEKYIQEKIRIDRKSRLIGNIRLLVACFFLLMIYYGIKEPEIFLFQILAIFSIPVFVVLLKMHNQLKTKSAYTEKLIQINDREIRYMQGDCSVFKEGLQYLQTDHPYLYDLDIFGKNSLFQHLNRTICNSGEKVLVKSLTEGTSLTLTSVQESVGELSAKADWRQSFSAWGMMMHENSDSAERLLSWSKQTKTFHPILKVLTYLIPVAVFGTLALFIFSNYEYAFSLFSTLFMTGFIIVVSQLKKIKNETDQLNSLAKIIFSYSKLIEKIETEKFDTGILNTYQKKFHSDSFRASKAIHRLSSIVESLESINNAFALFLFNGLFMYHLHTLDKLYKWKKNHAAHIESWIESMALFDAMNSLANFHYNHPGFSFPERSDEQTVFEAIDLGHPLIPVDKRICNDVNFDAFRFIVLTGSNMSGKSTFLRSIGINLVLMKCGAPVCAKKFISSDFTLFTSMRVNDSLSENESYFYAELKRLHELVTLLESSQPVFVILDEILRGTNSDDKRLGTEGLIRKIIQHPVLGIIATHDISIADMKKGHPGIIEAKCFEVEIKDKDLHFDYKLRDGVCVNKSATFLMEKMNIIASN